MVCNLKIATQTMCNLTCVHGPAWHNNASFQRTILLSVVTEICASCPVLLGLLYSYNGKAFFSVCSKGWSFRDWCANVFFSCEIVQVQNSLYRIIQQKYIPIIHFYQIFPFDTLLSNLSYKICNTDRVEIPVYKFSNPFLILLSWLFNFYVYVNIYSVPTVFSLVKRSLIQSAIAKTNQSTKL